MGFFDNAQEVLDRGVSAAKGAVSGVAVEQQAFVKGFARLCSEGSSQGWHESNGGNASYRLAPEAPLMAKKHRIRKKSSAPMRPCARRRKKRRPRTGAIQ